MNRVKLDLDVLGNGTCFLNDEDISDKIHGVQIMAQTGKPTNVYLATNAGIKFEGDAVIHQVNEGGIQPGIDFAVALIEKINPNTIQAEVLDAQQWGKEGSLTALIMENLKGKIIQYADELGQRPEST
jgi:hypothetical protein